MVGIQAEEREGDKLMDDTIQKQKEEMQRQRMFVVSFLHLATNDDLP